MSEHLPFPPPPEDSDSFGAEPSDDTAGPPAVPTERGGSEVGPFRPEGERPRDEPEDWGGEEKPPFRRYVQAVKRHRLLVVAGLLVGAALGYGIWHAVGPEYVAEGSLWLEVADREAASRGPIRAEQLLTSQSWLELLGSFAVMDSVSTRHRLFVRTDEVADSALFVDLELSERFRPGSYRLEVDSAGRSYALTTREGLSIERRPVGDSIGRELGLLWRPEPGQLARGRTVDFTILHPRDASKELLNRLETRIDQQGKFIQAQLRGEDPERITVILNGIMEQFVSLAAELKREKVEAFIDVLEDQRDAVAAELSSAESELESFRVQTITLPSDASTPIAPGLEATRDPVFENFFEMKVEQETLQRDRDQLARVLARMPEAGVEVEAFEVIPSVQGASQLQAVLGELTTKRTELRALLYGYTEDYPPVRELREEIRALETRTIPALARGVLRQLDDRIATLETRVDDASNELRSIPSRSIEEARLRRQVSAADALYRDIDQRYQEARLEAAGSIPDVRILDEATVPQIPTNDQRLRLVGIVLLGCLGMAMVGAVALDRTDPKVRYPEQVEDGMGLRILGGIPRIGSPHDGGEPENASQVLEAFRELRLNVAYAHGSSGPILITVASPAKGDGKTFVASNLAVAFAELGRKTLVMDGDTRRGDLHKLLNRQRKPGLVDGVTSILDGDTPRRGIIQQTDYPNLHLISSGERRSNSPEVLASSAMQEVFARLKKAYDVIIVDSPPLGAGGDAFVLSTLTGNLVLVLRRGATNLELTRARLAPLDRFPVRVLGAAFNDVDPNQAGYGYYYSYMPDYEPTTENGRPEIGHRKRVLEAPKVE